MVVEARKRLFTVDEFYRMSDAGIFDDDDKVELLGGEIFVMPAPGPHHASIVARLNALLSVALAGRAIVRVQDAVRLDDLSQPLPDVAILHLHDDFYVKAHPTPLDVHLLIEVMDTSVKRDREEKLPRYAAAGIAEVWLIDLAASRIDVHLTPRGTSYEAVSVAGPSEDVSPSDYTDVVLDVRGILGLD